MQFSTIPETIAPAADVTVDGTETSVLVAVPQGTLPSMDNETDGLISHKRMATSCAYKFLV